jgi:AcrR family transcriptional regulator
MNIGRAHTGRVTTRAYRSPLRRRRAEDTRATVLAAATRLFSERGWAGTGIRDVAREAGVSVETVYAAVGTKATLLEQALDVAIVGDDEPVALPERPEFAALADGDLAARVEAAARLNAATHARTAGLLRALREGAGREPALAARLTGARDGNRATLIAGAALVAGRPLGADEGDGIWAVLSPEVFELLTGSAGWSTERYRRWLADTLVRLLTDDDCSDTTGRTDDTRGQG